jgi:hypothetical protein
MSRKLGSTAWCTEETLIATDSYGWSAGLKAENYV